MAEAYRNIAKLFLSEKRTIFLGCLAGSFSQSSAASSLIVTADNPIRVRNQANTIQHSANSFLIPAGTQVIIDTQGTPFALCFLDALGQDLENLALKMRDRIQLEQVDVVHSCIEEEDRIRASVSSLYSNPVEPVQVFEQLDSWITAGGPDLKAHDPRIAKAIEFIKSHSDENFSISDLAAELNMSIPHLLRLFKQTTGIPARRYRLWHRLYVTSCKVAQGEALTEAALAAGFADAAHFSRTFKEIIGIRPSDIFSGKQQLELQMVMEG